MVDVTFPKIYLIFIDGMYLKSSKLEFNFEHFGTGVLYVLLFFMIAVNFYNHERENRLINQIAFNFNMQED
jgi:hypothetical protein